MPVYQRALRGPDGQIVRDARNKQVPWLDKHGTPRWTAQVYVGRNPATGKIQFLSKTFRREKDAQQWARTVETRKDKGDRPTADRRTLAEYMQWWLRMKATGAVAGKKKGRVPRARTMADYRKAVERWILHSPKGLPMLGACRLDRLTYQSLDAFYDAMLKDTGATAGTVQRLHGVLRQALEGPARKGSLPRNPTDWASVPRRNVVDLPERAMDQAQAARFLGKARQDRHSALWHLLLLGGLRPGEAFGLKWADVDMEAGTVRVMHNLVRLVGVKGWQLEPPKTKKSRRTVPLPAVAMRELSTWKTQQKRDRLAAGPEWQEHEFVFTTEHGTPLHGARRSFERVMAAAEIGTWGPEPAKPRSGPAPKRPFKPAFRIYDLRHTCATLLLLAGESLKVVSERLGHATITLTADTYSHVLPTMQRAAADRLEAMFGTG
jgi:integrase